MPRANNRWEAAWMQFDALHPEVAVLFERFARELLSRGYRHGSTQQILGRVRWETAVNPRHDGGYKINENFKKYYARRLGQEHAEFSDFFRFRGESPPA